MFEWNWKFLTTKGCSYQTTFITQLSNKTEISSQKTKAAGSSLPCLPCARNVLTPTQHVIHSDFDFFLSYFIMFVLFFFSCFLCLCVCVLICSFCVSTPPLLCLQLALSVSTHPSDLIPSCMPASYILLCHCLTINYHCFNIAVLTNKGVISHCAPSELVFAKNNAVRVDVTPLKKLLTWKTLMVYYIRSVDWIWAQSMQPAALISLEASRQNSETNLRGNILFSWGFQVSQYQHMLWY